MEEVRENSVSDVSSVRNHPLAVPYIDPNSGTDVLRISRRFLNQLNFDDSFNEKNNNDMVTIPLITRREFIYRTMYPHAKDNPYNSVLKGYVTCNRDEEVARLQRVDFISSTMAEEVNRYKERNDIPEEKIVRGKNRFKHKLDGKA